MLADVSMLCKCQRLHASVYGVVDTAPGLGRIIWIDPGVIIERCGWWCNVGGTLVRSRKGFVRLLGGGGEGRQKVHQGAPDGGRPTGP